jgi:hypothetical protein
MKQEICLLETNQWSINAVVFLQDNTVSHSASKPLKDGQLVLAIIAPKRKESLFII